MDSGKTVVVSGVPSVLSVGRMADKLTIHFQSGKRSRGGDVEKVTYPTNMEGVAFVTFDKAEDAEKVLKEERQILKDDEFPEDYQLTVFPFSRDVFFYVASATLDLSVFGGDQASLIDSLRSAHRSIRFASLPEQIKKANVEGPFSAIKALREDLMQRARRLPPSAQSTAVQPNGPTKTRQAPKSQKSSAEPREVPKPKTQRDSPRQRVLNENYGGRSSSKDNEEDLKAQSRRDANVNYGRTKSRQVVGEEGNARVESSLSRLHPAEEKSAKQPRGDAYLPKQSRSGRIFKEENSGSRTDYVKDLSYSKLDDSEGNKDLHPGDSEDFWVDLYTFKYIQKFDQEELERCFRGLSLNKSIQYVEGGDLVQLRLAEKQPTKSALRIFQTGLESLQILVEVWQSQLRVQEIVYLKADEQKLARLCGDMSSQVGNVIYVIEDSCVKIIGPSTSSHLFYQMVKDRMDS